MRFWKVQKFASDIVYDLRNRGLLPIAALLVVGILAVPILIKRGGSEAPPPAPVPTENAAELAPENQSAVLAYQPGLRDYKQRLRALQSKDPFIQQFAAPAAAAASTLDQAVDTGGGGVTGDEVSTLPGGTGDTGETGGGAGGSKKGKAKTRYYYYETDVSTGESGGTLARYNKIQQFAFMPSPQVPVLVFLGVTSGGSQAIFLVAKDVTGVGGEGVCFPSPDACQLLGLNSGKGADLIYGVDGKTYHLQVERIKRVASSKPPPG